jgi:hypothetical protein
MCSIGNPIELSLQYRICAAASATLTCLAAVAARLRQTLGAVLLQQGGAEDAIAIFEKAPNGTPLNGWALWGAAISAAGSLMTSTSSMAHAALTNFLPILRNRDRRARKHGHEPLGRRGCPSLWSRRQSCIKGRGARSSCPKRASAIAASVKFGRIAPARSSAAFCETTRQSTSSGNEPQILPAPRSVPR